MKTKAFILSIALLMCGLNGMAQDSYREAVKAHLKKADTKPFGMLAKMEPALTEVNKLKMEPFDEAESERLIRKYSQERLMDVFMDDWLIPAFQKNVTEAELKELATLYQTPEGKRFMKMNNSQNLDEKERAQFSQRMKENLVLLMLGQSPKTVKPVKGISKEYIKLFNQYYDEIGMESQFDMIAGKVMELATTNNVSKNILKSIMNTVRQDMRNTMLNSFCKKWTEEDLKVGIKIASMPSYKHSMNAASDVIGTITKEKMEGIGEKLLADYIEWLDKEMKLSPEQAYNKAMRLKQEGNLKEAYTLLSESAKEGYVGSQVQLAIWYYRGTYVVRDQKRAFEWFLKAAEQGDPNAEDWVGSMYGNGEGVEKNHEQAFAWYKKSVEHDYAHALCHLGYAYEYGLGTPKDYNKAMECYNKAIEKEEYMGMYRLGLMYCMGHGVAKNYTKGFEWMLKAGEKEVVEAYRQLEYMYSTGTGTKKDPQRAAYWQIKYEEAQKRQ
ncbi:MAG: SEL1-like repeat protein [Bacteroidaceae bacterium]|nr:SEL1-like repeat protein [Bacteroidaceae bacterium]